MLQYLLEIVLPKSTASIKKDTKAKGRSNEKILVESKSKKLK